MAVLMIITLSAGIGYLGYKYYQLRQTNNTLTIKYNSTVAFADACAKRILDIEKDNTNLTNHIKDSLVDWKSPKKRAKSQPKLAAVSTPSTSISKTKRKWKNWKPRPADKK